MTNVFDSIVNEENSLSDLLCNCLKYDELKQEFLKFLEIDTECDYSDFSREYHLGEYGRCDLVIENAEVICLIEIKVYDTPLTDNQPYSYIKFLNEYGGTKLKRLYFLTPENYEHTDVLSEEQSKGNLIWIHWQSLLKVIPESSNEVIIEFKSFLTNWFYMSLRSINENELSIIKDKSFPSALSKIMANIDALRDHFSKSHTVRKAKTSYEFGFYIDSTKYGDMFYGIWYEVWESNNFPVVLCSTSDNFKSDNNLIHKEGKWHILEVNPENLNDQQDIIGTLEPHL